MMFEILTKNPFVIRPLLLCLSLLVLPEISTFAQEVTAKQKRKLKVISTIIDKAGRLYKSKKYESSGEKILDAMEEIENMASTANSELMQMIKPEYKRLRKAHQLLGEQGIDLPELNELPEPVTDRTKISFVEQVAPMIVNNCGRCHVNQSRGDFSAMTYNDLVDSMHLSPGRPESSRIVEVIGEGSMPPNGQVASEDFTVLKMWIQQGAKFDGNDPTANLNQLAGNPNPNRSAGRRTALSLNRPTGEETVSFGRDIAPILLENCSGCHINSRQIRGNLSMDSFANVLRGGSSGILFQPGNPQDSLITQRLKGINSEVMPPNSPMNDEKVELITRWIQEGATFDGGDPAAEIEFVIATAKSDALNHEALSAERAKLAVKNWNLVMSNSKFDQINNEHLRIIGGDRGGRLTSIAEMADELIQEILDELDQDDEFPFVKGDATIFILDRRYDLNELGRMLTEVEIAKEQIGYWDYTIVDAYAAVILNRGNDAQTIKPELARQLTALHVASMAHDVPRWFADGTAYFVASRIFKGDNQIDNWRDAARNTTAMQGPFSFAVKKLSERENGLAGFEFIQQLNRRGKFKRMIQLLQQSSSFESAFAKVLGAPPEDYFREINRKRN